MAAYCTCPFPSTNGWGLAVTGMEGYYSTSLPFFLTLHFAVSVS